MGFTLKLAWRNIFRNKRRTFIAGIAIGVGLATLIFTDALILGMKANMIHSATAAYSGEGQIHRQGFRLTQDVGKTINGPAEVIAGLEKEETVEAFTRRAMSFGMITSPANVSSVLFVGLDPESERPLSHIDDNIQKGNFFSGPEARDIVIGSELADLLEVSLGDRVVVTVSQAGSGSLAQDMFRVSGIYHFNIKEMDGGFAFVRLEKAQEMLGIGTGVHEIAIKFRSLEFAAEDNTSFWEKYSVNGNEAVSWMVLLPQLKAVLNMVWISLIFMAVLLFGIVAFGIINTLFMSLYERMFEFGVIRAVGTRPGGVRRLVVFEAGALAVLSIAMGTLLGLILTLIVMKTGIDYRGIEFAGTTFYEMLYPELHLQQFLIYPAAVFLFTLLVGLYPAGVAARMSISDALRKSL
ncbi:MAG TPA: FtsX-like permease family protein [Candidatus Desulfaltia sp.]|nr:FtsX-like permease family protein [Candidatus Desulfaltia sp.]